MDTGKQHPQGIPVMDPRGETPTTSVPMAARPSGLNGITIGLVDNTKINAGKLLDRSLIPTGSRGPSLPVSSGSPSPTPPDPPPRTWSNRSPRSATQQSSPSGTEAPAASAVCTTV